MLPLDEVRCHVLRTSATKLHRKVQSDGTFPFATNFREPPQNEVPRTTYPRTPVNTRSDRWLGALECAPGDHRMRLQKLYNPVVASILRSPLHGLMSKSVMLLTYRGRRSGRSITTPISYVQDGEDLLAVASRDHAWWKNLRGGAPVRVRLRGRQLEGTHGGGVRGRSGKRGTARRAAGGAGLPKTLEGGTRRGRATEGPGGHLADRSRKRAGQD
jgi:deazaflavin-dependent oxidoreductase (nitroreductase family)